MLTPKEQETVILYSKASKKASIVTMNPTDMRTLNALPDIYKKVRDVKQDGKLIGREYECDKRFITLRKKDKQGKKRK